MCWPMKEAIACMSDVKATSFLLQMGRLRHERSSALLTCPVVQEPWHSCNILRSPLAYLLCTARCPSAAVLDAGWARAAVEDLVR